MLQIQNIKKQYKTGYLIQQARRPLVVFYTPMK